VTYQFYESIPRLERFDLMANIYGEYIDIFERKGSLRKFTGSAMNMLARL
jgi:hypothetical protein